METPLHRAQISILDTLRHVEKARYSQLLRPTSLQSDVFKFHLRKLVHAKYICKDSEGWYSLTPLGKEFANNLDESRRSTQKQPKLSIAIVVSRQRNGTTEYLFQKRLRNPFYNAWAILSGPVQWGQSIESTAAHELTKQTGLTAVCDIRSFYRVTDFQHETGDILEDKLFAIVATDKIEGAINNEWSGGLNQWMSIEQFMTKEHRLDSSLDLITALESGEPYAAKTIRYQADEY